MKIFYRKAQKVIEFPVPAEERIRRINENPYGYDLDYMKQALQDMYPDWYAEHEVGKASKADIMDVIRRFVERWSRIDQEEMLQRGKPSTTILTPNDYPSSSVLDLLLEGDKQRLTQALRLQKILEPYESVSDILYEDKDNFTEIPSLEIETLQFPSKVIQFAHLKGNWYRIAQQEQFPFYGETMSEPPPPDPFFASYPKNDEFLSEVIDELSGLPALENALRKYGFEFKTIKFENGTVIIRVDMDDGTSTLITDIEDPYLEDPDEWVVNLSERELYDLVPPKDFSKTFWDELGSGFTVFHATDQANLDTIQKEGLSPMDKTRGINNKGTGSAVFTSDNPDDITSYGDTILEINVSQMKADGYTPYVSKEGPIEEAQTRENLGHMVGVQNPDYKSEYYSEGLYDTTLIFYDVIPPKYITVIE